MLRINKLVAFLVITTLLGKYNNVAGFIQIFNNQKVVQKKKVRHFGTTEILKNAFPL